MLAKSKCIIENDTMASVALTIPAASCSLVTSHARLQKKNRAVHSLQLSNTSVWHKFGRAIQYQTRTTANRASKY